MTRRILRILFLLVVFLVVAGGAAFVTLHFLIRSGDTVIVPDLVDKDVVYALEVLTGLGLNTKVAGFEYSSIVPKNRVLSQDPVPGRQIKKDRDVKVILSAGTKTVIVPRVIGMTLQQASVALSENGMEAGWVSRAYAADVPKDVVIAQFPASSSAVDRGAKADLLICLGRPPETFMMPDLVTLSLDEALLMAEKAGLEAGEPVQSDQPDAPPDVVLAQDPEYGYPIARGARIQITVNRPPGEFTDFSGPRFVRYSVPVGFSRNPAQIRLGASGAFNDMPDDFAGHGSDVWLIVPDGVDASLFLYVDGKPVRPESSGIERQIQEALEKAFPARERLSFSRETPKGEKK